MPQKKPKKKKNRAKCLAIVDIGSNSVRLVIYKQLGAKHKVVMDKKATCRLALGMKYDDPHLSRRGIKLALAALADFSRVIEKNKIPRVIAVGTAAMRAVRSTKGGKAFHRKAEKALGHKITIISGREEARLTAYGLMAFLPKAIGICGDLGGGSLELAAVNKGRISNTTTSTLGTLTLLGETDGDCALTAATVKKRLHHVTWLKKGAGQTFYAIGGSWRGIGRVIMQKLGVPPRNVHGFSIKASLAKSTAIAIAQQKPAAFRLMAPKISRRADIIPVAAATLAQLIDMIKPRQITFSGHGVREGIVRQDSKKAL